MARITLVYGYGLLPRAAFSKVSGALSVLLIVFFGAHSLSVAPVKAQDDLTEHRDILIARAEDRLVVGTFAWGSRHIEFPVSVHWGKFDQQGEGWAMSSRPGFNALEELPAPYQAVPSGQKLWFSIQATPQFGGNLGYWGGTGPVQFQGPASGETLSVVHALTREEVQFGGDDAEVPGFVVGNTGQGGVIHEHHEFVLKAGQNLPSPSPGLYAFTMQLEMDGQTSSDLVAILLQWGEVPPDAVSRAMTWLNQEFPAEGEGERPSSSGCRIDVRSSERDKGRLRWPLLILLFLVGGRRPKVIRKS